MKMNHTVFLEISFYMFYLKFKNRHYKGNFVSELLEAKYATTRRGMPAIEIGRYRFTKNNRSVGPRALWVCARVSTGCRASLTTIDDIIVREKLEHNH